MMKIQEKQSEKVAAGIPQLFLWIVFFYMYSTTEQLRFLSLRIVMILRDSLFLIAHIVLTFLYVV